uniref:Integrase core domain-containing protein n=1 Tax=Candidatus Kentrum sp. LPFa TaxID=2126335 RepID=A0A450X6W6_9GAMM|nr:MAG: hypothetical protein BECKLPF1236B_GA0070989_14502 [Candidatus Kentron sp. LPFa]
MVDGATGEIRSAQIFVAVLGASNYTYAEATWSQGLPDWISSHVRTFEFFGDVTQLLVPDNLKSAVYWARQRPTPLPPRCREGVDSPHLPTRPFRAQVLFLAGPIGVPLSGSCVF